MFGFKKNTKEQELKDLDKLNIKAKQKIDNAVSELPEIRLLINNINKEIQVLKDSHKIKVSSLKALGKNLNQNLVQATIEVTNFVNKMKLKELKRLKEDCEDRIERIEISEKAYIISNQELQLQKNK